MNNTALGAKKVLFISEAHEIFYNEKLNMVRYKDVLIQNAFLKDGRLVEVRK